MRKKTTVRIETRSLSVIRPPGSAISLWCTDCAAMVSMVTPESAAKLCGASTRAIYQRIEADELHFSETSSGELLVCCPSLQPQKPVEGKTDE